MCAVIENPASCKVLSVIRFLFVENHKPIENHRQLCKVYENEVMSEGRVKQWCIMFKNDRTNVHDEERSDRPTFVTNELVAKINEKIHENRRFTITELFPNMKTWFATQRFDDDTELQAGVNEWLKFQAVKFYDDGVNKLVHRYDKCLNLNGDYVEKV